MHLLVLAHALVWLENGNHQSRAKNHRLGKARHESEGQVQEEMKKLKIINRSGVEIQLTGLDGDTPLVRTILQPRGEYKYAFYGDTGDENIRLDLPHGPRRWIYLYVDFMKRNKIAYVRKGDGDCWFVDPIRRGAKLVRKCVRNGTTSQIAVAEFVLERIGEAQREPGSNDPARWTAWSEITVDSRSKEWLIVDPVAVENKDRRYFGREGGGPQLLGSIDQVNMLRQQNNNVNGDMHEIMKTKHNEHVEVKERPGGMLDWTSSRRPWFLV